MNIMNLNCTVVAAWKHTFISDITWNLVMFRWLINVYVLGDSQNYMLLILVPSSAKRRNTNCRNCKIKWRERFYIEKLCL